RDVRSDRRDLSRRAVAFSLRHDYAAARCRVPERHRAPRSVDPGGIHGSRDQACFWQELDTGHGTTTNSNTGGQHESNLICKMIVVLLGSLDLPYPEN